MLVQLLTVPTLLFCTIRFFFAVTDLYIQAEPWDSCRQMHPRHQEAPSKAIAAGGSASKQRQGQLLRSPQLMLQVAWALSTALLMYQ